LIRIDTILIRRYSVIEKLYVVRGLGLYVIIGMKFLTKKASGGVEGVGGLDKNNISLSPCAARF